MGFQQVGKAFSGFGQGLSRVGGEARKLFGTFSKIGAIAGLTGGGLVGGLYKLSRGFADAGAQADEMAQKLGLTAQQWQSMAYAAKMNGVDANLLQGSYEKLNQNLIAAAQGGKTQAAAFKALGVSLKSIKEPGKLKATDHLMTDLADAFSKLPNDARKATLATQIFGQAGTKLLPMLNKGAAGLDELRQRAVEYGLVFDGEAVAAGAAFNESLDDVKLKVTGLGYSIGRSFLPAAQGLLEMFGGLVDENRNLIKVKVAEWAKKITEVLPKIKKGFKDLIAALPEVFKRVNAFAKALGGWNNIAKIAAAVMGGPLVRAIGGLILPLKALGVAIMTTPVGLLLGLAAAFAALMVHAGVMEPFLNGVSAGFSAMSGYVSEAFVGLVKQLAEVFGIAGDNLRNANGEINPEAWNKLGEAIGSFAGSALVDLVNGLTAAVRLFKELGQWLGSTAGKFVTGVDVDKLDQANKARAKLAAEIQNAYETKGALSEQDRANVAARTRQIEDMEWAGNNFKKSEFLAGLKGLGSFDNWSSTADVFGNTIGLKALPKAKNYLQDKIGSLGAKSVGAGNLAAAARFPSSAFKPQPVKTAPPLMGEGAMQTIREISEHTEIKETKVEVAVKVTAEGGASATGSLRTSGNSDNVSASMSSNASKIGLSNSGG